MKTVIVYFSWSNNTKRLVEVTNKEFNFPIYRIERKIPYSEDYSTCAYVEAKEEKDKFLYPEIKEFPIEILKAERILLFFPIWWYTFPMPIGTFIKELKGYKGEVISFANSYTNDPQYVTNSIRDIKKSNPEIIVKEGLFNKSVAEHIKFIKELD